MKKYIMTFATLALFATTEAKDYSQNQFSLGFGYLGETFAHPGVVIQAEYQHSIAKRWSIPYRAELGYYFHKRNHQATTLSAITGIRFHATDKFYLGAIGGVGVMASWHHSDKGVFEVGDDGTITKVSNFAGTDLLISVGCEFAYNIHKKRDGHIWLRPKYLFQKNVNQKTLGHTTLEIGYSFTL